MTRKDRFVITSWMKSNVKDKKCFRSKDRSIVLIETKIYDLAEEQL